jgi:hypothetical protein
MTTDAAPFATSLGRAELQEALRHLSRSASRRIPKVGNDTLPTPWDLDHKRIDELLTLLELAE